MIYYANPCGLAVYDAMLRGDLGCITTPVQGNVTFPAEIDTIADNGCFSDRWDERSWWSWLIGLPRTIRFAVCPDVYDPNGGECHEATVERWERFATRMKVAGFTPAFVCQVGATPWNLPADAEVLFLGGTTEWKLGPDAEAITMEWGDTRWVHMGRVNSLRRLRIAQRWGCRSVDGTYLIKAPDICLPRLLRFLRTVDNEAQQQDLFAVSSREGEQ